MLWFVLLLSIAVLTTGCIDGQQIKLWEVLFV